MAANGQRGITRAPRRAAGIRIALGILRTNGPPPYPQDNLDMFPSSCDVEEEQNPSFTLGGVSRHNPIAALQSVGGQALLYPSQDANASLVQINDIVTRVDTFLTLYMEAVAAPNTPGLVNALNDTQYPGLLKHIAKRAKESRPNTICVGDRLSIADVQVYAVFAIVDNVPLEDFNITPEVTGFNVQEYHTCRAITNNQNLVWSNAYNQTHACGL